LTRTHQAAWRILLPAAVEGAVVVADFDSLPTEDLLLSYPRAVVLRRAAPGGGRRAVVWDGRRAPLRDRSVGLLVVDERRGGGPALDSCLRPGATTARVVSSRRRHRFALYPSPEELEWITAPGWPVLGSASWRRRLARLRATTPLWRTMDRAGLALTAPKPSLVDSVLAGIGAATGTSPRLRGVVVGRGRGQLTLRVGARRADLAVRLALTSRATERLEAHRRAQDLLGGADPGRLAVPEVVAGGETGGATWLAERWLSGRSGPGGRAWAGEGGRGWVATRAVARALAERAPTGRAGPGWARAFASALLGAYPDRAAPLVAALGPIEAAGLATAWIHGDLWPGNVFLRHRGPPLVIDWDLARPDGPAGLDAVFAELCRLMLHRRSSLGQAAAVVVGEASPRLGLDDCPVGGRRWGDLDAPLRRALVVAALVGQASAGSTAADRGEAAWWNENLAPVAAALRRLGAAGSASDEAGLPRSLLEE
jgi:hypothetical protein